MLGHRTRPKYYKTPAGQVYTLFNDMAEQPHLLVAGATGSGKSVVVNGIVYNLLHKGPASAGLILIDPKRVELVQYKDTPHCIMYASEPDTMVQALQHALQITEARYTQMQQNHERKYSGGDIYVIIDELADLMTTQRKKVQPLLQRLAQIGRAAKIHIIACTQCPLAKVIPTEIKVNFDARVGLRTRCAQDSRNILGVTGCEMLPRYGHGYYMTPEATRLYNIPMYSDEQIDRVIHWWTSTECIV
jgi:S-DNA-T family DNA segregation ATPase FtsK/SpoIIIE